jgi:hypothetical protein
MKEKTKMKFAKKSTTPAAAMLFMALAAATMATPALADETTDAVGACLKAWGTHPFGKSPHYKSMQTSVKVFGIGKGASDTEVTSAPTLILVNPGVNVMGGSTVELLNPNGWYCLRTNVNVMGGVNIRAHCNAHLASSSDGATVLGENTENKGVTVMGSTKVERVGCK